MDGCYWFNDRRIGWFALFLGIGKKKKLIDTGFWFGFSGSLDIIVRGRELVFLDYWTPWLAGVVFSGCLDLWIDVVDQSTSDTKVSSTMVPDNGSNALIFDQGNYLSIRKPAVKST